MDDERTVRERLDHLFKFEMTADSLAREIAEWRPGDAAIVSTPEREYQALRA